MNITYSKIGYFFKKKTIAGILENGYNSFNGHFFSTSPEVVRLLMSSICLFFVISTSSIFAQSTVVTTFNSTGLTTWTAPTGVTSISVEAWGGGAGGGGGKGGLLGGPAGGGGGGGAYSIATVAVTPGLVYNIGVGGGGGSSNNNGTAGNTSYFSTPGTTGTQLVVALGGSFGVAGGAGGVGGVGASGTGTSKYSGGNGATSGGGGSSGGTAANGGNGSGSSGGTVAGGGSGGNSNTAGSSPGGGGGGGNGGGLLSAGGSAGANGGVGQVKITYSIPATLTIGTNAAVVAANICPSVTNVPLHSFTLTGANNPGNFTGFSIVLGGTYKINPSPDIANLKLWTTGTTSTFSVGGATLLATIAAPTNASTQTFPGFSTATSNSTIYYWVTMDVTATAASSRTIYAVGTLPANITSTPTTTGFSNLSGTQSMGIGSAPLAPNLTAATNVACTSATANWNASASTTGYFLDVSTSNTFASYVAGYNNLSVGNVLTYNVSGLTAGTVYYYRAKSINCGSALGIPVTPMSFTTAVVPATPAAPTATPACNPASYTLSQNTTGLVAPNALYWQGTTAAGTSTALPATSTYYVSTSGMYYIRSMTPGGCWSASSGSVNIIIGAVTGGTIASNQSICGSTTPLGITSTVDGTGGGLTYSWQYDATSAFSAPTTVGGANSNVYAPPVLAATRYYRRVSTVGACSDYSNVLEITVAPAPVIVPSANVTICSGQSTNLSATGSNTNVYSWANSTGLSNVNISNPVANPTTTTTYTVTGWGTSTEKVINGTFNTATGSLGFTSDYVFWPMATTGDMSEGHYFIGTQGKKATAATTTGPGVHSAFSTTPGHGGSGNQLVVNGAGNPGANVWCETFAVAPNSDYAFSTWVSTQNVGDGTINAAAKLQFSINDIAFGTAFYAPLTVGPWNQFFCNWNSGLSTSAKICVVNQNTTTFGNDFALDDMSFAPYCSGTANVTVTVPQPVLSSSKTPAAVCSGTTFAYTATSTYTNPTFAWTRATVVGISNGAGSGTGNISETLINTTTAPILVTYIYRTTSQTCVGVAESVVVTVNPKPTLNSALTSTICSGIALSYQPTSAVAGASFSWSRATVAGINEAGTSNTGSINEVLTNSTGVPVNVTYVITPTANGCVGTAQNVVVTVKGSAKLSSTLTPSAICSGATFAYTATSATAGATFAWSRAAVVGISQALSSGTGNVSEALTNTTASAINVTYAYTTTANGCSNTQNVVVSVTPGPQLNSTLTGVVCSGNTFAYTPTSATSPVTFAWTRANVVGITPATSSGTAGISEALTNSTTGILTSTYVYTATSNGCVGAPQNLVVTVNPIPSLSSSLTPASICSGTTFAYTATSATAGATFAWTRAAVAGITQAATSGTLPVSEILDNTTTGVIPVVYSYITTANGCSHAAQNVTVGVKPLPSLSSTLSPAAICSGATFGYTANSATVGATFAWTRATVSGITEAGNSGATNPVSQVLTNTSSSAINVTYSYTTSFLSCSGSPQNVVVAVNPSPQGVFYGNTICNVGGDIAQLTFESTAGTGPFNLLYDDPSAVHRTQNAVVTNTPFNSNPNQTVVGSYVYTLTSVTDANACVRTSAITTPTATVIVTNAQIVADPSTPTSQTTCAGTTTSFFVSATGVQTYGWEVNTTGANGGTYDVNGTWTTVTGAEAAPTYNGVTAATLVVTNATTSHDGYRYRAAMLAACGSTVYSSVARLTVNVLPVLTSSLAPSPATCSGQSVVYTPSSGTSGVTFAWTRAAVVGISDAAASGAGGVNEVLHNTTVNSINVTYVYTTTNPANSCVTPIQNVIVTINPSPVLSSTTGTVASMCSPAAFTYTPFSASIGASFAWTRATIAGITEAGTSGTGAVSETLHNTTTSAINVTYVYVTTANTCPGVSQNIVVTVNPAPILSSTTAAPTICTALNNFSYTASSATAGASFSWTRATVAGITEVGTSGTSNPVNETLTNTTTSPISVTYVYSTTAGGCSGNSTENVVVIVNPVPMINSSLTATVCSAVPFTYNPLSATLHSTFAWTRATVAGITPVGTSGTEGINETLTNTTSSPVNVTYVYTTTANGCAGPAQGVVVTVNPTPTLSSATTASICSETAVAFAYTPTSGVSGATFAWTRATVPNITQAGTSGVGAISEVLTNTYTAPIDVTYVYTATANGCSSPAQNVVVTVKPRPRLSTSATANVCSGSNLTYTPNSATASPTFGWTRASVAGITAATDPNSGTGTVSETLTNTTTSSINVSYIYTTTANGCATTPPDTVVVTVIPKPNMTSANVATICTGTSLATNGTLTFTSDINSDFAWTRANTASIGPAGPTSGSSNPVSEVLTNATAANITTTYIVTPTSNPGGCAGTPQSVNVTVTPVPAQPNAINGNPN